MKEFHQSEVVVVGAGAVGCSIAYWLAKRGVDVTLVDKSEPGAGTSTLNFGLVWVHSKRPYTYMEFSLRSSLLWPEMVEELGEDVDLRQGGGLQLCLTEAEYEAAEALMAHQQQSPLFKGRMLSPQEVFEIQPGASPEIVGASWSPHDGDCNSVKWTMALARGCRRIGVEVMTETEVVGFDLGENNGLTGVLTNRGRIVTRTAVNAGGPWAAQLARMVGVTLGLFPQRGQILVSEPARIVCPTPMFPVRQDDYGQFYMGSTHEDVGLDWSTTPEAAQQLARDAAELVPFTQELEVVRHYAGVRPMPRDGLPFLGPVPHVPGYYVAVGHSGITLSPIHGKVISDLIVDGETELPIADYDPLRYDERGTTEPGPERSRTGGH